MTKKQTHLPLFFFASQVTGDRVEVPKFFIGLVNPRSDCTIAEWDWANSEKKKVYAWDICMPFDGILISLAYLNGKRKELALQEGLRKAYRIPNNTHLMCDCGAWQYKHLDEVPYTPEQVIDLYEKLGCDFGITLDQLVLKSKLTWKENGEKKTRSFTRKEQKKRMEFTLQSAKVMKEVSSNKVELFASVQGVTTLDYARMIEKYIDMGYSNFAIGGIAKTHTTKLKLILNCVLEEIKRYRLEKICRIHVLGVGRPTMWNFYKANRIFSFDTSRYHRIAWIKGEYVYWNGFELKSYDVRQYDYRNYHSDPPIPDCMCPVCQVVGKDKDGIVWPKRFGTNQRNMSRGFHNLWHFYRYYQTMMKKTLVLIACSKIKLNSKSKTKDIYQGRLFKLSKYFAITNNHDYQIISAKYGLLHPEQTIEPYNEQIKTKQDVERVKKLVIPELRKTINQYGRIIVLAGSKYREVLQPLWDSRFVFIKSKGYGDLCKKIANLNKQDETLVPYIQDRKLLEEGDQQT